MKISIDNSKFFYYLCCATNERKEAMAHHKSAIKRIRQSERARLRNRSYKSRLKTEMKKLVSLADKDQAVAQYRVVTSLLDRMVGKGIIHRNYAANRKAKLARFVNQLG